MKFNLKEDGKRIIIVCLAAVIMALNIKSFVRTGGLYPGGVTGLTLLIQRAMKMFFHLSLPYTVVNVGLNMFPVYIGYRFIGKKFTLYSCLMILLTSILTDILPGYVITYDILLISIFGGIVNGFVISLCLMSNVAVGGSEFLATFLSERKGMDAWNLILGLNVLIIGSAGILFGWDKALYSIIFQYTSTQVLYVLYKKYQQETLFVVTNRTKEVYEAISKTSHHGATIMEGIGSYEYHERTIIYSVVSSAESKKVIQAIKEVDENAFINVVKTEQVSGRFYQKPHE